MVKANNTERGSKTIFTLSLCYYKIKLTQLLLWLVFVHSLNINVCTLITFRINIIVEEEQLSPSTFANDDFKSKSFLKYEDEITIYNENQIMINIMINNIYYSLRGYLWISPALNFKMRPFLLYCKWCIIVFSHKLRENRSYSDYYVNDKMAFEVIRNMFNLCGFSMGCCCSCVHCFCMLNYFLCQDKAVPPSLLAVCASLCCWLIESVFCAALEVSVGTHTP